MSNRTRDESIMELQEAYRRLVENVNKQNLVIQQLAMMVADLHHKAYPEQYNEDGSLKAKNAPVNQTDSQPLILL